MAREDDVAQCIIEEKLGDQQFAPLDQDAQMDMHGAAGIPARIDAPEIHDAILVADLPAAQEGSSLGGRLALIAHAGGAPGIDTFAVHMPNLNIGILDRRTGGGPDDAQAHPHRQAGNTFAHISADGDIIGVTGTERSGSGRHALRLLTEDRRRQSLRHADRAAGAEIRCRPVEGSRRDGLAGGMSPEGQEGSAPCAQQGRTAQNDHPPFHLNHSGRRAPGFASDFSFAIAKVHS
jgi:hypothetical protein